MAHRNPQIYDNFEVFLAEATLQMQENKSLSMQWLTSIRLSFGSAIIAQVIVGAAAVNAVNHDTSPFLSMFQKEKIEQFIKKFKRKASSQESENERLEKVELLFNEYNSMLTGTEKKKKIDELYQDVIEGNEIYY